MHDQGDISPLEWRGLTVSDADIERRLNAIHEDLREVKGHLIGSNGHEGALGRLTKIEEQQTFARKCFLWLAVWVVGLSYMLVPAYIRQKWSA